MKIISIYEIKIQIFSFNEIIENYSILKIICQRGVGSSVP